MSSRAYFNKNMASREEREKYPTFERNTKKHDNANCKQSFQSKTGLFKSTRFTT